MTSHAAATPPAEPAAVRSHVPMFIGDVGFTTRNMFANRSGRPRSLINSTGLAAYPAAATQPARLASVWFPASLAARHSADEPPASPPVNRYQPISCFHTGGLM